MCIILVHSSRRWWYNKILETVGHGCNFKALLLGIRINHNGDQTKATKNQNIMLALTGCRYVHVPLTLCDNILSLWICVLYRTLGLIYKYIEFRIWRETMMASVPPPSFGNPIKVCFYIFKIVSIIIKFSKTDIK